MKVKGLEILRCDAGWRNYHFLKLTTDEGIVGWSEFDAPDSPARKRNPAATSACIVALGPRFRGVTMSRQSTLPVRVVVLIGQGRDDGADLGNRVTPDLERPG